MNIRSLYLLPVFLLVAPSLRALDVQTAYPLPSGHTPVAVASNGASFERSMRTDVIVSSQGGIAFRKVDTRLEEAQDWDFIFSGNANDSFRDLIFANGLFVAVGVTEENGEVQGFALISNDGEKWERNPIPEARGVTSVTFGNGKFVIAGEVEDAKFRDLYPATFISNDAKNWNTHQLSDRDSRSSHKFVTSPLQVVRFLAGRFIGASEDGFHSSEDGVNWTYDASRLGEGGITEIAGNDRKLVAVGPAGVHISGTGGSSWSKLQKPYIWSSVAYFSEKDVFVAVGAKEQKVNPRTGERPPPSAEDGIAISKFGSEWTFVTPKEFLADAALLTSVCGSGGEVIAVGPAAGADGVATAMTSSDGQNWNSRYFGRFIWTGLFSSDGTFYAAGTAEDPVSPTEPSKFTYRGAILKSTDGLNWDPILKTAFPIRTVAKGGGNLITFGPDEYRKLAGVYSSANDRNWNVHSFPDLDFVSDVVFGNGTFVAIGTAGTENRFSTRIAFSDDDTGERWTRSSYSESSLELRAITYGAPGGTPTFVAVGGSINAKYGDGLIVRSRDNGKTWKEVTPKISSDSRAEKAGFTDVTFAHGAFIAVGHGIAWTSSNGEKWEEIPTLSRNRLQMTHVEGGPDDLYVASDIFNNKTNELHSALSVHDVGPSTQLPIGIDHRESLSLDLEPIYSLTSMGKKLVLGTDYGITRVVFKPSLSISAGPQFQGRAVREDDDETNVFFVVTRDKAPDLPTKIDPSQEETLTVHYTFSGSATPRVDYSSSGRIEFRGSQSQIRIPVSIKNDSEVERPENIVCTLSASEDYVVGAKNRAAITIHSEDVPTCNFSVATAQVTEGKDLEIVVKRNSDIGKTTMNVTVDGSSTASSSDYTLDTTVVFKEGETTQRITLGALTDELTEGTEKVVLQLSSADGSGKAGIKSTLTISIPNVAPSIANTITVTAPVTGTGEASAEVGIFRIERTGGKNAISVNVTISGTAQNGTDYILISSPVQIPAFINSVDVGVTPINDANVEGNETVILTLQPGEGYTVGGAADATVNLLDDDD